MNLKIIENVEINNGYAIRIKEVKEGKMVSTICDFAVYELAK